MEPWQGVNGERKLLFPDLFGSDSSRTGKAFSMAGFQRPSPNFYAVGRIHLKALMMMMDEKISHKIY